MATECTGQDADGQGHMAPEINVAIIKDGPYLVTGGVPLSQQWIVTNADGESLEYQEGQRYAEVAQYALCRCGQSANKPFCDGTHQRIGFDGTETAARQPYLNQAKTIEGPTMYLTDAEPLCAFARFCDVHGRIWNIIQHTVDATAQEIVKHEAAHCPGGRLVVWDRATRRPIEPVFEPSIALIEDTAKEVSGPIWVRGGIPIMSSEGSTYELRNRVALCRCGKSKNKPYCDGSHVPE